MRIGVDAMGGDHAPVEEVRGALASREFLAPGDRVVLIGHEDAIREQMAGKTGWEDFVEVCHAEQVITMDESPVEALRGKPDSSIAKMAQMQADGKLDACISAGNTGACVAAAQMRLRRLSGVHRPGIAILTPTFHGPVAICDVGANVNCRPQHLYQYGLMASIYVNAVCGVTNPRVAILNVGEEDAKGNSLVRQTRELFLQDKSVRFIGNVESRDLFSGLCDVMVCDGFVGNVVLKLMEGMAYSVLKGILKELSAGGGAMADAAKKAIGSIMAKYDFNEYGGAPLLGVGGICIICHGASNYRGIMNAIRVARDFTRHHVNEQITQLLAQGSRSEHA